VDRDQQRGVDADRRHGLQHVGGGDLGRAGEHRVPRTAGMVALVAMNLDIDRRH